MLVLGSIQFLLISYRTQTQLFNPKEIKIDQQKVTCFKGSQGSLAYTARVWCDKANVSMRRIINDLTFVESWAESLWTRSCSCWSSRRNRCVSASQIGPVRLLVRLLAREVRKGETVATASVLFNLVWVRIPFSLNGVTYCDESNSTPEIKRKQLMNKSYHKEKPSSMSSLSSYFVQGKPLNVITLGPLKSDNNKWLIMLTMITLSGFHFM